MSDYATREAIIGGDDGIWGDFETEQNRRSIGANTTSIYLDSGNLKLSAGRFGIGTGTIGSETTIAAVRIPSTKIISVVGLTVSCWAKVEGSISGATPTISIISIAGATNPASLPSEFINAYIGMRGGRYIVNGGVYNKRCLAIVWINAAGAVEGIVNEIPGVDGYVGYSTSDDTSDKIYEFFKLDYSFTMYTPPTTISKNTSYTILNLSSDLIVLATRGANGIRLTLPAVASNAGRSIEIINVDTGAGCTTLVPNGETISGFSYIFLTETYQRVKIYCDGSNWYIISGVLYWMTGSRNTNDYTNRELGMELLTYDTKVGTILIGDRVTETETGNTWIVIADSGTVLTCISATGTGFATNNNHLTFSISGATALVNNTGTDKNADTNMVHAGGRNACRFEVELYVYAGTTFTWDLARRIGRVIADGAGVEYKNYELIQIDSNTLQIQTAANMLSYLNTNGTCLDLDTEDYTYNAILKMVF